MARFSDGDVVLILKDHQQITPANIPPNFIIWDPQTFTDWGKGNSYSVNDIVNNGGLYYFCKSSHTSNNSNIPPNDTFWEPINKWASGVTYLAGERIIFSDMAYVCINQHVSEFGADENGDVDISEKWVVIEHSEKVPQSIKVTLNAKDGRFMTKGEIIKKFDRIYYQYTDNLGKVTKDVFHVRTIKRKRGQGKGKTLVLSCPHQSENLWKKTISFPGRKNSGDQALRTIVRQLNSNQADKDPQVELPTIFNITTKVGSRLSTASANDYIFESKKLKQTFDEIRDIEQQPAEGGGRLQAMYIRFVSKYDHATHTDLDTVQIQAFEQGFTQNGSEFNNTPKVTLLWDTLQSGNRPNVLDLDTNETPPKATNIIAIGQEKSGSYPVEHQKFTAAREVFNTAKTWLNPITYSKGNLVVGSDGLTYESITDGNTNNPPPDILNWIQRIFEKPPEWNGVTNYIIHSVIRYNDIAYKNLVNGNSNHEPPDDEFWTRVYWAPTVDYSPLTKDVAQNWVNSMAGAKYADQLDNRTAVFDKNCIIKDVFHPRDPVRILGTDPDDIPASHKVDGRIPNGYKMLVVLKSMAGNTATDVGRREFAGNDPQGVQFRGNIAEYRDPNENGTGTWFVFLQNHTDSEILDIDEAECWVSKPCPGLLNTSTNVCSGSRYNTWRRGAYKLPANITGLATGTLVTFQDDAIFECLHPVASDAGVGGVEVVNTGIQVDDISGTSAVSVKSRLIDPSLVDYYDPGYFVGLNFWSLTPLTSNNIPKFLNPAPVTGEKIKLSIFDFYNMFKTHGNKEEWFGPQSEDYYPIQSFAFFEKFIFSLNLLGTNLPIGDYKLEMWFADQRHNVMTIEFPHFRNAVTLEQDNDINKMKPYFGVPGVSVVFNAKEPEVIDVFQPREWQFGGIETKDSFDKQGRYQGFSSRFKGMDFLQLIVDSFRMKKPLVATNVDEPNAKPERNIETARKTYDGIYFYSQLKNLVLGLAKLFAFEKKEIVHKRKAKNDLQFGDPVFTKDTQAFSEEDNGVNSNTILAVVNGIVTTHSKPKNGPGGSEQTLDLITRFFP